MELESIVWPDGANNIPGIAAIAVAKLADIATLPDVVQPDPVGNGSFSDLVTVSGNIVMEPGKTFKEIYFTDETGELRDELVGETDGKSYSNTLEILVPGEGSEVRGLAAHSKNSNYIFIVQRRDGKKFLFGSRLSPAKLQTAPGTTGKAFADRKGRTFTWMYNANHPAPEFTGEVDLTGTGYGTGVGETNYQTLFAD